MKVMISYPPLSNQKGCPMLGQNRQFQYFKQPTYIYPVVPAQAATLLKQHGYQVLWNDALAQGQSRSEYLDLLRREKPDLIAFEAKTPVIKEIWRIIDEVKTKWPACVCVLFGDHVSALPEESLSLCKADFILTGGDYDFLLLNLCDCLKESRLPDSFFRVGALEAGIYYRSDKGINNTGKFRLNHNLDALPLIDRQLTRWELYSRKNGNYKRRPGTYIMSGRDCWWGKCSFCSWPALYPSFRVRSVENVLSEIEMLIAQFKVREIMDDTGCFPVGGWLRDFCSGVIKRGINQKVYLDCNMRFGALTEGDFALMKKANFRLLLFGLESANQNTLDRINKNLKKEQIIADSRAASRAGLFPHITLMFGYPWETYQDARETLKLGKWLLRKGYAYTMQATIVIPYPGSTLFKECKDSNLLRTSDWDDYDMKQPVIRSGIPDKKLMGLVRGMYKISFHPEFIFRKIFSLKDIDDLRYYLRAGRKVFGHIFDFKKGRKTLCL